MTNFHGDNKNHSYFEGWYFKQQIGSEVFAIIPSISINKDGTKLAFVQIITNTNSYNIEYSFSQFKVSKNKLFIKIGRNIFCDKYIYLDIKNKYIICKGKILFSKFTPIKYNIMGVFGLFPFMECNHGVLSLYHKLNGEMTINNNSINFNNGLGYIEKDWGSSFPKKYAWIQSNDFDNCKCCVLVSVAEIPFLGFNFRGCICVVYYKNKEYRLATYNGVRIIKCNKKSLILEQKQYRLEISIKENLPQKLSAPDNGNMTRIIHENACCTARFIFIKNNNILFDYESTSTSFEFNY